MIRFHYILIDIILFHIFLQHNLINFQSFFSDHLQLVFCVSYNVSCNIIRDAAYPEKNNLLLTICKVVSSADYLYKQLEPR